ncbi:ATP-binding protein [Pseudohalocynthiibacter sp. F2068]|uniref:AlbA family DNA-binding domain-containing protein n=1 Tax=Pseudohalocynthiibacter sp. F2068 TaxID=2926418 RepID=UPI001FF58C68|nr:ATP-binding protein [Pseudohalocynthiibacter sp. F2068]MCK0103232.1 ATP-binding protein [Pseudohalocynthiibacter sp. F2068]
MITREKLLDRAQNGVRENKTLDFKSEFNLAQRGDWCEIIKDIVAFANSGGGVLVIGLNDSG